MALPFQPAGDAHVREVAPTDTPRNATSPDRRGRGREPEQSVPPPCPVDWAHRDPRGTTSRASGTLGPGVLPNGHLRRGSLALRDDEECVAIGHDVLRFSDEMIWKDHELAGVAPYSLVLRLRDSYGSIALLQTTLANEEEERVSRIRLEGRLYAFIDHPRRSLILGDALFSIAHPPMIGLPGRVRER